MSNKNSVVATQYGPIKGVKVKTHFGDDFYSFQKIPYAKPPLGELRFRDPVPPEPWKDQLDASSEGPVAYSWNNYVYSVVGNENCLHMNVFTKNLHPKTPTPVMVYIHGGAFVRGSSSILIYGPDYLLQNDVVFVSFNYRLGAFGFLSLKDSSLNVPGNAGLKDQCLALKWIKENIANFGGDPNNITLFGESAGAASVHFHMISPQSQGLFNRAILMSGCIYNNWALVPPRDFANRLGTKLELTFSNETELLDQLRQVSPEKIIIAQEKLLSDEEKLDQFMSGMGPVIEPYKTENSFIADDIIRMSRAGWGNSIDILIGGCSNEGLLWYKEVNEKLLEKHKILTHFIPLELRRNKTDDELRESAKILKDFYFNGNAPSMERLNNYITLIGDKNFWHGFHRTLLSRLKYSKAQTYLYRFDIVSNTQNHHKLMFADEKAPGACHADDKSYLFKTALGRVPDSSTKEHRAIQRMVNLFTNFAITGNPNGEKAGVTNWNPIRLEDKNAWRGLNMKMDAFTVETLPESERMKVWDRLYEFSELI